VPNKPLRPCRHPGCGVLTVEPFCIRHEENKERSNWSTKTPKERGYGHTWVKLRKLVMLRDGGICQVCLAKGQVKEATEVDHIIPKAKGGTDHDSNLQAICKQCHQNKTAMESADGQRTSYYPEWLPKPKCKVTIVCGPPGSGKTTYCKQHAGKTDLIIDVDEIAAQLTGKPLHEATMDEMSQAIRVRNKLLADLATPQYNTCWFITTGKYEEKREWWKQKLNAELVLLDVDKRTCIDRIKKSDRSDQAKKRAIEAILGWE
jgi:5-methylcytosine-specific restriction endonuclease McrA/shikimate kinase